MDKNLFGKYQNAIVKQQNKKKEIQDIIFEATHIHLQEEEIEIEDKKVSLYVSSVKKTKLHKTNIQNVLKKKGYILSY